MLTIEFDQETKNLLEVIQQSGAIPVFDIAPVLIKFYSIAGAMCTMHIRRLLGQSNLYILNAEYREKKLQNPYRAHMPDTATDSPLILTGALYNSINAWANGDGISIGFRNVTVSRMAQYHQWKSLRAELAMKPTMTNTHSRRRTPAPKLSSEVVAEYANKWEGQLHFMERGIKLAIPDMAAALSNLISEQLSKVSPLVEVVSTEPEPLADWQLKAQGWFQMFDGQTEGNFTGEGAVYPPAEELAPLAERQAANPVFPSGVDVNSAEFDAKYKAWDEARTAQLEAEHGLGVNARPEFGPRTTLEVTDDRWLKPHQVYVKSDVSRHAFDSQQAAQRAGMTYEQWVKSYKPEFGGR